MDAACNQAESLRLEPGEGAEHLARRAMQDACLRKGLSLHLVDDASRLAGELVAAATAETRRPLHMKVAVGPGDVTIRLHGALPPNRVAHAAWLSLLEHLEPVKHLSSSYGYSCDAEQLEVWAQVRVERPPGSG